MEKFCQLIPEREKGTELDSSKISRLVNNHKFFKGEDETFMALLQINVEEFCFNQKEHGLHSYYYRTCTNLFEECLTTPPNLYKNILDALTEKNIFRSFY